jgi:DNA-binding GntR family transcriptional regulator
MVELQDIPLYRLIHTQLSNDIYMGKLKLGDLIPTESELMARFSASRTTIRHAMSKLVSEGLLVRKRGVGTFVAKEREKTQLRLTGSFEDILDVGRSTLHKVIRFEYIEAPPRISRILQIPEGEAILRVDRVRFSKEEPFLYSINYLPDSIGRILNKHILQEKPLLEIVAEQCNLPVVNGKQRFRATLADQDVSKLLNLTIGSPLLEIERVVNTKDEKPLYLFHGFFRSDLYSFIAEFSFSK